MSYVLSLTIKSPEDLVEYSGYPVATKKGLQDYESSKKGPVNGELKITAKSSTTSNYQTVERKREAME